MSKSLLRWTPVLGLALAFVAVAAPPMSGPKVAVADPASSVGSGGALAPTPVEREVASIVAEMLQRYHYEDLPIDDALSSRWYDLYLDSLDYNRMILLKSDVEEFEKYRSTFDDAILGKDVRVEGAITMYERYRMRMRERVAAAQEILAGDVDVTNAEAWVPGRHEAKLGWPTTAAEADELWRQRIEEEFILGQLDAEDSESVDEIRDRLVKRYDRYLKAVDDVEGVDVMETWLGALARSYDPHSAWFKPATNDDFDIEITNSVSGIGAQLQTDGDFTVVKEIIPGGPAFKNAKLLPEDKILAVSQGDADPVDMVGLRIDKVVRYIRGEVGTEVRLHVKHASGDSEVISMVRDRVTLEASAVESHIQEVDGHKLGVVDLPSFYVDPSGRKSGRRASEDVKVALQELRAEGAEGVVLDLRGNGGGSLIEAIDVAGLFLTAGPIVQVRTRSGEIEALFDSDPQVHWLGPMVVLTDPTSASASEIVAGALQDYGRAVVVGSHHTHGKGTVQQVAPLTPQLRGRQTEDVGGALKLTIQKFYRVSGSSTQNKGVEADVVFPSPWDGLDVYESDLPNALTWDRIPPAPHVRAADLAGILPELDKRSAARVAASEDFDRLDKMLEERDKMQARTEVSLVLDERRAEYEARKAHTGGEDPAEPAVEDDDDAEEAAEDKDDYVLDEAFAVLADVAALTTK